MNPDQQRIAIAEACGFKGCADSTCDYRKCQHLHKDGKVFFPEPYSTPRYPDYLNDLNAMHEAEKTLFGVECENYARMLTGAGLLFYPVTHATASQRAEAFLRVKKLWKD